MGIQTINKPPNVFKNLQNDLYRFHYPQFTTKKKPRLIYPNIFEKRFPMLFITICSIHTYSERKLRHRYYLLLLYYLFIIIIVIIVVFIETLAFIARNK